MDGGTRIRRESHFYGFAQQTNRTRARRRRDSYNLMTGRLFVRPFEAGAGDWSYRQHVGVLYR